jgi:hypothetical protein
VGVDEQAKRARQGFVHLLHPRGRRRRPLGWVPGFLLRYRASGDAEQRANAPDRGRLQRLCHSPDVPSTKG